MKEQLELYNTYFKEHGFERLELFQALEQEFQIQSALYLGSFVHLTPALVFPQTTFVDSDKRMQKFFADQGVRNYIESRKLYEAVAVYEYFQQDYDQPLELELESYDLLISQYAGFVSQPGKQFLKPGGLLLANNSHADAGIAFLDPDYELIGVINKTKNTWNISYKELDAYFKPKSGTHPSKESLFKTMKGIGYTKTASNYLFRKIV